MKTEAELKREFDEWADAENIPPEARPYCLKLWQPARDVLGIVGLFGLHKERLRPSLQQLGAAVQPPR